MAIGCLFSNIYLSSKLSYSQLFGLGSISYTITLSLIILAITKLSGIYLLLIISIFSAIAGLGCSMVYMCQDLYVASTA